MGVADRLYETACECRDLETRVDALLRDLSRQRERADNAESLLGAFGRAAGELLEALDDERHVSGHPSPAGVEKRALELKHLIS
jgi:hypothetical protein